MMRRFVKLNIAVIVSFTLLFTETQAFQDSAQQESFELTNEQHQAIDQELEKMGKQVVKLQADFKAAKGLPDQEKEKQLADIARDQKELKRRIDLLDRARRTRDGNLTPFFPGPSMPGQPSTVPQPPDPTKYGNEQDYRQAIQGLVTAVCVAYPPYCAIAQIIGKILGSLFGESSPELVRAKTQVVHDLAAGDPPKKADLDVIAAQPDEKKAKEDVQDLLAIQGALPAKGAAKQKKAAKATEDSLLQHPKVVAWIQQGKTARVTSALALAAQDGKSVGDVLMPFGDKYESQEEKLSFLVELSHLDIKSKDPDNLKQRASQMAVTGNSQ